MLHCPIVGRCTLYLTMLACADLHNGIGRLNLMRSSSALCLLATATRFIGQRWSFALPTRTLFISELDPSYFAFLIDL